MAYQKDLDGWHALKKQIEASPAAPNFYFNEREIWFCSIGHNVGYEQDGTGPEFWRPVVIVKKYNRYMFAGIPLTSKVKPFPFYFGVGNVAGRAAMAIISQIRPISSKRLVNKIETMDKTVFEALKKATSEYLFGDLPQ